MAETIKILLVDDHDIVMDGIASILNEVPHLQVVGKATSAAIAEGLIRRYRPDLVLTDISMGKVTGLALTEWIMQQFPATKIIVLTMHDGLQHITEMLEAGAMGYLLKNIKQEELLAAIESVAAGRPYIQHSLAPSYARSLRQRQAAEKQSPLSPREIEILRLVAQDMTSAQISRQLFLSVYTIETHRKNIVRKTGVKSVIGLVNYAREQGLLS
jgi:DNA-binding NarL/FixJ family response regulator